ncbi:hypothetical protein KUTeg_005611 [Tegillarca granosa]|uniref:Uncharacterized protein n=1 Tax=Tegillarca granosa TaxID=220873 RepID=A0ABQ9FK63_TEGGR|nr:hypothetical protein KUTeg_005611 [Tegillarca granosa]
MVRGTVSDKGWAWIVMVSSFFLHVICGSFVNCVGIFHTVLLSKFKQNVTYTAIAGAVFSCLLSSTGPFSSWLITRYSCRITIMIGGFIFTIGCLLSAFQKSLEWVIVSYGVIAGIGSGLIYTASVVVVGFNFERQRNLASGMATSGAALGIFVLAPVYTTLETAYGYEGLFILSAGFVFHCCVFGALCRPSELESKKKHNDTNDKGKSSFNISLYIKLLRKQSFVCICISVLCWSIGVSMVYLHLPYYVITLNTTPIQAAWIISAAGIGGFSSRFLSGLASNNDDIDDLLIYSGSFCVLGICTILFPLYAVSYIGQLFYGFALGVYSGSCYAVMNSINVSNFGINNMATAYGVEMFFCGSGMLLGPPLAVNEINEIIFSEQLYALIKNMQYFQTSQFHIRKFAGLIVDNGGTSQLSFTIGGCAIILGGVFGMLTVCFNDNVANDKLVTKKTTLHIVPDSEICHNLSLFPDDKPVYTEPLIKTNDVDSSYQETSIEKTLKFIDDVDL